MDGEEVFVLEGTKATRSTGAEILQMRSTSCRDTDGPKSLHTGLQLAVGALDQNRLLPSLGASSGQLLDEGPPRSPPPSRDDRAALQLSAPGPTPS
ncbi:unnamed protein product [Gadus morhua 'NCC']